MFATCFHLPTCFIISPVYFRIVINDYRDILNRGVYMKQVIRPIELPTINARNLALRAKIMLPEDDLASVEDAEEQEQKLAMFQQMAINSKLEMCMSVYELDDIDQDQQSVLSTIHKFTKHWVAGHVTGELLKRLSDKTTPAQTANEISQTLLEITKEEEKAKGKKKTRGRIVKMELVDNTKTPANQ